MHNSAKFIELVNVTPSKVASEATDYIKNVKPTEERTIMLVLTMTAGEYYGANRNGDAWPEKPLRVASTKITEDQVLPNNYKTFETNANVYKHHINKNPEKRLGIAGDQPVLRGTFVK